MSLKTVSVIIVSDEILQCSDEYSLPYFLLKELSQIKYHVNKVTILPENIKIVTYEIQQLSKQYDIVLVVENSSYSSITCQALAKGLCSNLKAGSRLENLQSEVKSSYINQDFLLPSAAKILVREDAFPVIYLQRIFLLKSCYLNEQFSKLLKNILVNYRKEKYARKYVEFRSNGCKLSLENFHNNTNNILIDFGENQANPLVKIEAHELEVLNCFIDKIKKEYSKEILRMYVPPLDTSLLSEDDTVTKQAINDIVKCFEIYGPENVFIAFNGGKDCTVLLHLMNSVLRMQYPNFNDQIFCLYVQSEHPFPEQDDFLRQSQQYYDLKIKTVQSVIKEALAEILQENVNLKACLMGTRRTDPYSADLKTFQMTDPDWPQIMRVSPLLDWHHSDIWDYLLYHKVFYCKLYDMGYTSLGSVSNTSRNPSLLHYDIFEEKEIYLPAYKLLNESKERNGRVT